MEPNLNRLYYTLLYINYIIHLYDTILKKVDMNHLLVTVSVIELTH